MVEQLMLSVVDQSPVRDGDSAGDALRDTIELAAVVEKLGYQRYWLAEHHSIANFAGTSPEVLIGQVAARYAPHPRTVPATSSHRTWI